MNELDLMGRLQHPNIVRLLEYFLQDDPSLPHCGACIIVMDLLEGADLMDYIDEAAGFSRDDVMVRVRCLLHTLRARRRERERERLCVCVACHADTASRDAHYHPEATDGASPRQRGSVACLLAEHSTVC